MKSVTSHNILNNIPIICITHKGLSAIKEIVRIAPQEAQWFHTVEPIIYKSSPNEISLLLSEKLYIPTQNTSAAQVDTTSSMMMDFYRELQNDYEDQTVVNQKLQAMTCWCHSHHNMSPNPSGQDDMQFNSFISMADDQNQKLWQIMLIFNKKDNFYSRVFDPETRTIHEGVPIHVINDYNFSYIHEAAKLKFKKPPVKKFTGKKASSFQWSTKHYQDDLFSNLQNSLGSKELSDVNDDIVSTILNEAFEWYNFYEKPSNQFNRNIYFSKDQYSSFYDSIALTLDDRELVFFLYFLTKQGAKIPNIFLEKSFEKAFPLEAQINDLFKESLLNKNYDLTEIYESLIQTLEISELDKKKECKEYIDNNGII